MKLLSIVCVFVALVVVAAPAANAQATRTWVSGVGDDFNPCSRTAPCKTFAGAISKTAAGGEISALDPGGFGSVTITKSITINGDGTLAGILASLTNGVTINAAATDRVVLRNLSINGGGNGLSGVRFLAGKSLVLDNVTISGFTTRGLSVALANAGDVFVKNSHITKCGVGVFASTTVGLARVSIENTSIVGNTTNGIEGSTSSRINVSNSVISGNGTNGVLANSGTTRIALTTCQVSYNVTGINASALSSITRLSDNDIFNNDTGVDIVSGGIETAGNNRIAGNTATDVLPPATIPVQ
jgi:hypothetical protein